MGRLTGFGYRALVTRLKKRGFSFYRQAAGSHELWFNPETKRFTTIPNHTGDIPEGTLRAILRQAGISVDDFLIMK
jgi:predicted RNA binding protein YcfA (HicA-like mRNA interferase family)